MEKNSRKSNVPFSDLQKNQLLALYQQGQLKAAIAQAQALIVDYPDNIFLIEILGVCLASTKQFTLAIPYFEKKIALHPNDFRTYTNLANALFESDAFDEAQQTYQKAIALKPDYIEAYKGLITVFKARNEFYKVIESCNQAIKMKPTYILGYANKIQAMLRIGEWQTLAEDKITLLKLLKQHQLLAQNETPRPFMVLCQYDDPQLQQQIAQRCAVKPTPGAELPTPAERPEKIRIGYFSPDFRNHPTMHLIIRFLELQDKQRFDIYAYHYHQGSDDYGQQRLKAAGVHFYNVAQRNDQAVRDLVRQHQIDIAIDLTGYTTHSRTNLFAYPVAAIQISYLGYPGTLGTDSIDYIIADKVVIPNNKQQFFNEKIIYLPHSYQVNDNTKAIAKEIPSRKSLGLPQDAFVFCCFNNNFKITPNEFCIWMRLLHKVENSVLWLLAKSDIFKINLQREAREQGIDAQRLIFAPSIPLADHLARHVQADLFLDTFICNAHTTASDALWMAVPVITKIGESFPARVCASLLQAIGLPELITTSETAYEQLALELATNPDKLAEIKKKLQANRNTTPLFDSEQFTRDMERAYQQVYDRYYQGLAPANIIL